MATGTILLPIPAHFADPTNPPGLLFSAANRPYLAFDSGTDELCGWTFRMPENFSSGTNPNLKIIWSGSASTNTAHTARWKADVMALTPETDSVSSVTDDFDTENTIDDDILGTTGVRPQEATLALANRDSVAAGDYVALRFGRDADHVNDDLTEDAYVWAVSLEYTTT